MKAIIFFLIVIAVSISLYSQSTRKANKDMHEWRYEIEAEGTGIQGSYQVKVWTYSKKAETAIDQAKKSAIHGVIFKGFPDKNRIKGQSPLATDPSIENDKEDFFKDFFADGGKYQKFVTLVNNGAISPEDRIKIGKEYKIGIVVSVNVSSLRKELEDAGIIKGLSNGF